MTSSAHFDAPRFATTRWSLVVGAVAGGTDESRRALSDLCQQYWYPLYAFARRRGAAVEDAQDLTQGFLIRLLESPFLEAADPQRGRFRAFLVTAFKNYVAQQHRHDRAQRRGGQLRQLSLNFDDGEQRYQLEAATEATPDRLFDQRWAFAMLEAVLQRLAEEYNLKGKSKFFEFAKSCLAADDGQLPQREAAAELNMTHGALRVSIHRMKQRYRELLIDEVSQTVDDPADVDAEILSLRAALRS